ncbi:MAG TPA: hypothetical protein ENN25_04425 [Euryarchaeota archaeon]|nr:hypothetical protein [Euryarchaeota archaeon]
MAVKRRIPKDPCFSSVCNYRLEIEGESVVMHVDCNGCQNIEVGDDDICWTNLVKGISETAMPDKIILLKNRTVLCNRRYVSIINNAALLLRRLKRRMEEIKIIKNGDNDTDMEKLNGIAKALLYDIPQLISCGRNSRGSKPITIGNIGCNNGDDDGPLVMQILAEKQKCVTSFD